MQAWLRRLAAALVMGGFTLPGPRLDAQGIDVPEYRVDPLWPRPLPAPEDDAGLPRQWVTGAVGGSCTDARGHLFALNRGNVADDDGTLSIAAPPVIEFDTDGAIVNAWGDRDVLPFGLHGCFVDDENNVWIAGSVDGVVQKWTHDGRTMLLAIGTRGVCDGAAPEAGSSAAAPNPGSGGAARNPTCGEPGTNTSRTRLNEPADIAVDPRPDPVTGEPGSIYVADGYGNHRIVVFDREGRYLRQWGSAGNGEGQFAESGGGHPHCVIIGNDGLVYTCDRNQNRIQVFERTGALRRVIAVDPPGFGRAARRAADIAFSPDAEQTYMYVSDLGSNRVWILGRESGRVLGGIGRAGHMAGEFVFPHTLAVDAAGNLYVAETGSGRRVQKFVLRQ